MLHECLAISRNLLPCTATAQVLLSGPPSGPPCLDLLFVVRLKCQTTNCLCVFTVGLLLARYNEGVSDLQGSSIKRARPPQLLWDDGSAAAAGPASAAVQTWVNTLLVDRGVSYEVSGGGALGGQGWQLMMVLFFRISAMTVCIVSAPVDSFQHQLSVDAAALFWLPGFRDTYALRCWS